MTEAATASHGNSTFRPQSVAVQAYPNATLGDQPAIPFTLYGICSGDGARITDIRL